MLLCLRAYGCNEHTINPGLGSSRNQKIKDDVVVEQGRTPMNFDLPKNAEYRVFINKDGYKPVTVSVVKSCIEGISILNLGNLVGWVVDYATGAMNKLSPMTIQVQLEEGAAQDGDSLLCTSS